METNISAPIASPARHVGTLVPNKADGLLRPGSITFAHQGRGARQLLGWQRGKSRDEARSWATACSAPSLHAGVNPSIQD
jgi:hypothetical protein